MSDGHPAARTLDRLVLVLTLAAALGVVAVIFHVDYLPTLDGPHHLLLGHLANHFDDPGAGWHAWLQPGTAYTARIFDLVFTICERFLAWRPAFQVALTVFALGWSFGYLALVRAVHPRRAALGLLGFATSISWIVYMGFFAFATSIAIGFTTLAVAAQGWPWTPRRRVVLTALLLLQAVAHAFGVELTGLVLFLLLAIALQDPRPLARVREIALLGLMGLPALLVVLTASSTEHGPTNFLSLADHLTVLPRTFLPGPLWRSWPPLLLGAGGVALTVSRFRRGAATPAEVALAGAAALHLVLAFTTPMDLPAWQLFCPRFLPFGCLLGAALLPIERLDARRRLAVVAGLSVFTAASLLWAARTATSLRAREDESLSGLVAPLHRTGPRLVVSLDALATWGDDTRHQDIPYYAPLFNLGSLYAIEQGGIPAFALLTNPHLHAFVFSAEGLARYPAPYKPADLMDPRIETDPAVRADAVALLAMMGAPYEDLILQGRAGDGDELLARGYAADFRQGGLFIGHLQGCPVKARVVIPAPQAAQVFVEYGPDPLTRTTWRSTLPPDPTASGAEVREVPLSPALCGPVWLRVALDRDGSGSPSKGDAFCAGADAKGRIHLVARERSGQTLECRIAP